MQASEYQRYDGIGLAELVRSRQVTPDELLDVALASVARVNPKLNAVVHMQEATARASIAQGLPRGPFAGVPFLLKDLGCEAVDFPTHNGSRLFADLRWSYDSEIYLRLQRTGLVTFGRTTSPELGIGAATEGRVYGAPTRNPWSLDHTPGGSSGGAGAAVAAGIVPMAHGSDGGGSVRIPASNCGLFGLKPTRARLPDGPAAGEGWGGMAIDGFLTRSVRDTAALIDATHGPDLGAPYWAPALAWPHSDDIRTPPKRLRLALCPTRLDGTAIHAACSQAVLNAGKLLEELGHTVELVHPAIDLSAMMLAWTKIVASGTAATIRARELFLGRPARDDELDGVSFGAMTYARTVSGADYVDCLAVIHAFGRQMAGFTVPFDGLVTATLAEPPAKIGRFKPDNRDFLAYRIGAEGIFAYSPFAALFNASGQPAASLPLHWTSDGLPVGVHIAGRFGEDATLLKLSAELEAAMPWFNRRPTLALEPSSP
jgi:amidase